MGAEEILCVCFAVCLAVYKDTVGKSATLGTLAAVRAAAAEVLAGEAWSGLAYTESSVYKDF